jgi:hypothetical protein
MLGLGLGALPVRAWNNVGHRSIAELVWRQMDEHERQSASNLLLSHPHYERLLTSDVPAGIDTNKWAFLVAAVWPDLVRHAKPGQPQKPSSITKYDLYPHAIGYPFVRPADRDSVSIENFFIAKPDAEMVLSNSIATLKDDKASKHDQAVSLCWTLHLVGDLHQPLHTATWVRKDKSDWDGLGGNYIVIDPRGDPYEKQIDLHSFWDRLGGVNPSYKTVADLADKLSATDLTKSVLKNFEENRRIAAWVQESHRIAVDFAYAEDRVRFTHIDDLNSGKAQASQIPELSRDYISEAERIAKRRLLLAAMRLTDELKRIW